MSSLGDRLFVCSGPSGDGLRQRVAHVLNNRVTEPDDSPHASTPDAGVAAPTDSVEADQVTISQGGAQTVNAREVEIHQGGAYAVNAEQVKIQQGGAMVVTTHDLQVEQGGVGIAVGQNVNMTETGAGVVVGRRVTVTRSRSLVVLAQSLEGEVETVLDTRGALLAGVGAGATVGLAFLVRALLRRRA